MNPSLHATQSFEVPNTPGVVMHDLTTVSLNKAGTIDHVINGQGSAAIGGVNDGQPQTVTIYTNGTHN